MDAGNDGVVSTYGFNYDQRGIGYPRQVSVVDIGAVELDLIFADGFAD